MKDKGIPLEILEELKLKPQKKEIQEKCRIIVEKHQVSIKIPAKIRNELFLKEASFSAEMVLDEIENT